MATTTGESVRKLLLAHFKGDSDAFRAAAREFIDEERRKNHTILARDLERIMASSNGNGHSGKAPMNGLFPLHGDSGALPRDKERDVALVELLEPRRKLADLVLAPPLRSSLDRIVEENRRAELLHTYGAKPANRILFCGPPGCGKTVSAEAIAAELYLPLAIVRFDAVVSSYLGETAANLRKVFEFAKTRPLVLLFDEFDAIGKDRASLEEHGEIKRVVNSFLQLLDGFHSETITIAATNHQGLLDPALWRRFDDILYFDRPDLQQIADLLAGCLRQIGLSLSVDLQREAKRMSGLTHAEIERVCREAIKSMILTDPGPVTATAIEVATDQQRRRTAISNPGVDRLATKRKGNRPPAKGDR